MIILTSKTDNQFLVIDKITLVGFDDTVGRAIEWV